SGIVSEAETAIHTLNTRTAPALAPLARLLLRSESIASSKIEGLQVSVREIARAEAKLDRGGSAGTVLREVLGSIDAMELAIERASAKEGITAQNIVEIHEVLMGSATNARVAGVLRTEQNWIGGNDYNPCGADLVPPPPEEVHRLLEDLCVAINDEHLPPIIQAGLVHAQFETIHPFLDGNGRTGRALVHVILRRRGISPRFVPPLSIILAGNKGRYISGLTAFRNGETSQWFSVFAEAAAQSATLASRYLEEVEALQERWRDALTASSNPRSDAVAWKLLEILPGLPIITVPVATAAVQRTKVVVGEGLKQLEEAGILARLSSAESARTWEATELLNLISDLEAGMAPAVKN
ncbi:MAG: Fic family protein, partial [Actinobacteria bacterium]|nr:Fic family protein [Actinomycetota bacterium]